MGSGRKGGEHPMSGQFGARGPPLRRSSSSRSRSLSESEWYKERSPNRRAQSPPENHRMPVQWNNLHSNPPGARAGPSDQRARGGQDGAHRFRSLPRRSPDSPPPPRSLFATAQKEEKPAEAGGLLVQRAAVGQRRQSRSLSPPPRSPSPFADGAHPAVPEREPEREPARPPQRAQQIDWAPPARQEEGGNRWKRRQSGGHWNSSRHQHNGERNGERRHHSRQESSRASQRSGDRGRHHQSRNGEGRHSRRQSSPPTIPANPIDRENERVPNRFEETEEHDRTQRRWKRDMFKNVKLEDPEVSERSIPPPSHHASGSRIVDVVDLDDDEQQVTVPVAPHLPTVPLVPDDTGPAPPGPAALPTSAHPPTHANIQMDAATAQYFREVLAPFFPQLAQASPSFMDSRQGTVGNHQFPPPVPSPYVGSAPGTVAISQFPPPAPSTHVAAAPGTVAVPQFPANQFAFPPPPLGTVPAQQFPQHQMAYPPPATPQYPQPQPYFQPYHVAPEVEAQQRARMEQLCWEREFFNRSQAEERRSREIGLEKLRIANEKEVQRLLKDREDFEMKKAEEEKLREIARMGDEFQLQMKLRGLETIRRIQEKEAERELAARRSEHTPGPSSQAQRMALEYQEMAAERDQWSDEEIPDTNFQSTSAGPPRRRYRPPTPVPRDEMGREQEAAAQVVDIEDDDEVVPDPNIPSTSTASPRGHWRVRGEDGKFLKPGSSCQMRASRQEPQRRSMAQASGPSSDVRGTSRPSRTAAARAPATPTTSSLAPSDPRRSTRLSTVAAGASIPATDTPTFSSLTPSDPRLSSRLSTVAASPVPAATPIPTTDTPSTSGLRRSGRASAGIPGWWRQPSEESEAPATRSTRKRASETGSSSSKKSKKDCADASSSPPRERSATPFSEEWRRQVYGGEADRGLHSSGPSREEPARFGSSNRSASRSQQPRRSPSRSRSPASPPRSRSPSPFTPEAIAKEREMESRGQVTCGSGQRGQRDLPVVPRDPSQQQRERGQNGGNRDGPRRDNHNNGWNRQNNDRQAQQFGAHQRESRYGGGSGPRDQDFHNRTSQPWRQNGGERLGGSGHKERELYRPPTQRGEQAAVTSSGQRDRRGSPARPQSGLRGRGHSSIHSDHPLRQDVKPESPEEIPTRNVPATSRRQIAAQPSRGSRVIDVIELGDDEEVPAASHAPPVVSAPAPPRAVPSSGQGMAHPYVQMDEATVEQFRGFLLQMFPPAPTTHAAAAPGTVAVPQYLPPAPSTHAAAAPGTVAVPQYFPPAPSTHVAAAPGTVAIPEFQMSHPPPPLGTVPVQQFQQHQMAYPQPATPQYPQPQPYFQPYHVAPEVEAQQRARMADQFRWEQEYFARRQGEERRLRELQLEQLRIAREHEEDRLMRAQEELERKKRREEQDRELTRIEEELALERRRREVEVRRWRAQEEDRAAEHPGHRADPAVRYPAEPAVRYPAEPAVRYPADPEAEQPAVEEDIVVLSDDDEEVPRERSPRVYLSDSEDEVELRMPEERRREQNERRMRRMPEHDAATPSPTPRERAMEQFHMDYDYVAPERVEPEQPNVPSTSDRPPRRRYRTPTPVPQEDEVATSPDYRSLLRSATFTESARLQLFSARGQAEQEAAAQIVNIEESDEDEAPDPNVPSTSTAPPRGRGRRRGRGRGRGKSPTPPLTGEWVRGKDGVFRLVDIDNGSLPEKRQFVADYEYRTSRLLPRHQAFAEVEADRQRRDPNAVPIDVAALARSNAPLPVRAPGSPPRPAPGQSPSRVPAAQSPTAPGASTSATTSTSTSSSSRSVRSTPSGAALATRGSTPGAPVAAPVTPTTSTPSNSRPARSTRATSGAALPTTGSTPGAPVAAPVTPTVSAPSGSRTTRLSAGSSSTPVLRRSTRATAGQHGRLADPESSDESDAAPSTSTPVRRSARKRASDVGSANSKKSKKDCEWLSYDYSNP